jgi:hypothetical protein
LGSWADQHIVHEEGWFFFFFFGIRVYGIMVGDIDDIMINGNVMTQVSREAKWLVSIEAIHMMRDAQVLGLWVCMHFKGSKVLFEHDRLG